MKPAAPRPDATRCPLCGEANRCAIELERETGQPQGPCWCMQTAIAPEALARLPAEARGLACICARCATQAATVADPAVPTSPTPAPALLPRA